VKEEATMISSSRLALAGSALVLAFASMAFARRDGSSAKTAPATTTTVASRAPVTIEAFALAQLLAEAPPDTVVIALDEPRHPLRFAVPIALLIGPGGDEAFAASASKSRRIVLAGFDQVRVDRLARRLLAGDRDARVLEGGLDAWDKAMDADPAPPPANAGGEAWQTYRTRVALRHAFGDASLAPAAAVVVPVAPLTAPLGAPKKREGC
jgi:hypothetical protein